MKFEVGKVIAYDDHVGEVVSSTGTYKFLDSDIVSKKNIKIDDYVLFRGEVVNQVNRAYFVRFFSKDIVDIQNNSDILERLLKKSGDNDAATK